MDGPPAKRARRTDSMAMWEKSESIPKPSQSHGHSPRHSSLKPDSRDRRHRSRSREHKSRRRERDKDDPKHSHDMPSSSSKDHRDSRDRDRERDRKPREGRSGSRDRHKQRRADHDRRRTPSRHRDRDSPPRGPRAYRARSRSRERHSKPANGVERGRTTNGEQESARGLARTSKAKENGEKVDVDRKEDGDGQQEEDDDEEAQMRAVMGFAKFRSTKNTKVPGNDKLYGVRKEKKAKYRQYMNRVGGFNRPLSPSAE